MRHIGIAMTKTIDTLIPDIEALLVSRNYKLNPVVDHTNDGTDREFTLRASNIGKPCARALWYEKHDYETEPLQPHVFLKFDYGHLLEDSVLDLAKQSGHIVEREQERIVVDDIVGHIDAVIDGILVDVKTASPYSFDKFVNETIYNDDPFGYIMQLSMYLHAIDDVEGAGFLVINKVTGKLHFMPLTYPMREEEIKELIAERKEQMEMDRPPPRAFSPKPVGKSGNMGLGVNCSYCPYKKTCYPELRTFISSRGPVYLTYVVREPRMMEVFDE